MADPNRKVEGTRFTLDAKQIHPHITAGEDDAQKKYTYTLEGQEGTLIVIAIEGLKSEACGAMNRVLEKLNKSADIERRPTQIVTQTIQSFCEERIQEMEALMNGETLEVSVGAEDIDRLPTGTANLDHVVAVTGTSGRVHFVCTNMSNIFTDTSGGETMTMVTRVESYLDGMTIGDLQFESAEDYLRGAVHANLPTDMGIED